MNYLQDSVKKEYRHCFNVLYFKILLYFKKDYDNIILFPISPLLKATYSNESCNCEM